MPKRRPVLKTSPATFRRHLREVLEGRDRYWAALNVLEHDLFCDLGEPENGVNDLTDIVSELDIMVGEEVSETRLTEIYDMLLGYAAAERGD